MNKDRVCITVHGDTWLSGLVGLAVVFGGVLFWVLLLVWIIFKVIGNE